MGGFTLDFCRKLERERDEARSTAGNLRAENDMLRTALLECERQYQEKVSENIVILSERDEAREALREIQAADWKTSGELRGMAREALKSK